MFWRKREEEPVEVDNTDILVHEIGKLKSFCVRHKVNFYTLMKILEQIEEARKVEKTFDIYLGNDYYIVSQDEMVYLERRQE